jgi:hypothetical protein
MNALWMLAVSGISLLVSTLALVRSDRARKMLADDIAARLQKDYDNFIGRIARAKISLADTRAGASEELRERIDRLGEELEEIAREARRDLERLQHEPTRRARIKHEELLRDMQRLEARVQLLEVKSEIVRAQRLASQSEFVAAEELLEAAASRMRDIRGRGEGDPMFAEIMVALQDALRAVRNRAENTRRKLQDVLSETDSLLGTFEQPAAG